MSSLLARDDFNKAVVVQAVYELTLCSLKLYNTVMSFSQSPQAK